MATKKTFIQKLEALNWLSKTDVAIVVFSWLCCFGMALNEPDIEAQNFFVLVLRCSVGSVSVLTIKRICQLVPKGIGSLWTKATRSLDN